MIRLCQATICTVVIELGEVTQYLCLVRHRGNFVGAAVSNSSFYLTTFYINKHGNNLPYSYVDSIKFIDIVMKVYIITNIDSHKIRYEAHTRFSSGL